jgi:hypothetical protein
LKVEKVAKINSMFVEEIEALIRTLQENPREYMKQVAKEKNPPFNPKYERFFAKKEEIDPKKLEFELEMVSDQRASEIFRSAMSFWSVPISAGYGRRMRFIVWDKTHGKVFGIFGLCDPVIGLKIRDDYIGWSKKQREERLYNIMSAYVLGAVPPYNELFGAKLVALAVGCKEVCQAFEEKYNGKKTIIRGREPLAKLVAVDTMAFFGKSLIYEGLPEWQFLGYTKGMTHVHLNGLWEKCLELAKEMNARSLRKNKFGNGPNWKFRVLNEVFSRLGMSGKFFETGKERGYYFRPLAEEWREFLRGEADQLGYVNKFFEEYVELWKGKYLKRRLKKWSGKVS